MTKVLVAMLVLRLVASVAAAEEPWLGAWQAEQDPGRMVRFHDGRHFSVSGGRLTWVAEIVAVFPGKLTVCSWGRPAVLLLKAEGDRLELGFEGQAGTGTFRRLAEVPAVFEPALLFDRLQVALARPQRYGTQLGATADGGVGVIPVEDRERVDERRASVGLPPLEEYVKLFGLQSVTYLECP